MDAESNAIEFDEKNRDQFNIPPVLACTDQLVNFPVLSCAKCKNSRGGTDPYAFKHKFSSPSEYADHCLEKHSVEGQLSIACPRCPEAFSEVAAFVAHSSRQPLRGYRCRLCDYVADIGMRSRLSMILYHFKTVHPEVQLQLSKLPQNLPNPKRAKMTADLRCLTQDKTGDSSVSTSGVGAVLPKFIDLKDGTRHACPDCKKTFGARQYLRQHRLKVHCKRMFPCKFCSKAFCCPRDLGRHSSQMHQTELRKSTAGAEQNDGSWKQKTAPMQVCIPKPVVGNAKDHSGVNRREMTGNGVAIARTSGATTNDDIVTNPVSTNCEGNQLNSCVGSSKSEPTTECIKHEAGVSTSYSINKDIDVFSRTKSETILISSAALENHKEEEEEDTKPDAKFLLSWDNSDNEQNGQNYPQNGHNLDAYNYIQGLDSEMKTQNCLKCGEMSNISSGAVKDLGKAI